MMSSNAEAGASMVPDDDDANSSYEDGESSLVSISESVLAYHEENGRSYHGMSRGKYALPNDEAESDRLDLQHELMVRTLGGTLSLCPMNAGAKRVLDIGTGTGAWAIDYADEHPEAEVIGVDLSPIQPDFVPPNCNFQIDDLEKDWTFTHPFDFIMCRMMLGSFADFPSIVKTAYDNLEPGGYLELQELTIPVRCDDATLDPSGYLSQWCDNILTAASNAGRPVFPTTEYERYMRDAGFEDVTVIQRKWPTNTWPRDKGFKELGLWAFEALGGGLEGLSLAHFTRGLGWTREETLLFCAQTRNELRSRAVHAYWPIYIVYGRKPV